MTPEPDEKVVAAEVKDPTPADSKIENIPPEDRRPDLVDDKEKGDDAKGDGKETPSEPSWRDSLPEELSKEKCLETVPDVETLTKNYVEGQKLIGGSVRVPKADASPEEIAKFHKQLGVPESPEGYSIQRPDMPAGIEFNTEELSGVFGAMHKAGYTNAQAQSGLNIYGGLLAQAHEQRLSEAKESEAVLKEEWGAAYDRNIAVAQEALRFLGGDDLAQRFEETGLGNSPAVLRMFSQIGDILQEDKSMPEVSVGGKTKDEMRARLAQLQSDPNYLSDANPAKHRETVLEVTSLNQQLYS